MLAESLDESGNFVSPTRRPPLTPYSLLLHVESTRLQYHRKEYVNEILQ